MAANGGRYRSVSGIGTPSSTAGPLVRMYAALAAEGLIGAEVYSLDATAVKAHPDAHGARTKTARRR